MQKLPTKVVEFLKKFLNKYLRDSFWGHWFIKIDEKCPKEIPQERKNLEKFFKEPLKKIWEKWFYAKNIFKDYLEELQNLKKGLKKSKTIPAWLLRGISGKTSGGTFRRICSSFWRTFWWNFQKHILQIMKRHFQMNVCESPPLEKFYQSCLKEFMKKKNKICKGELWRNFWENLRIS